MTGPVNNSVANNTTNLILTNNSAPSLPGEIWSEIFNQCDIKTSFNLSLVSRQIRIFYNIHTQIAKRDKLKLINKKIEKILSSDRYRPLREYSICKIAIYILDTQGFKEARKFCKKITDPKRRLTILDSVLCHLYAGTHLEKINILRKDVAKLIQNGEPEYNSIRNFRYLEYLTENRLLPGAGYQWDEAIQMIQEANLDDCSKSMLTYTLIESGYTQIAKNFTAQQTRLDLRCDQLLKIVDHQIAQQEIEDAKDTLKDLIQETESTPISEQRWSLHYHFDIINKCFRFAEISERQFLCGDNEQALHILNQAKEITLAENDNQNLKCATWIFLAEFYVKIGYADEGYHLLQNAYNIVQTIDDKKILASFLEWISETYHKYDDESKSIETLKESCNVECGNNLNVQNNFNIENLLNILMRTIPYNNSTINDIMHQIRERAAEELRNQINGEKRIFCKIYILLSTLFRIECSKGLFDEAKKTLELLIKPLHRFSDLHTFAETHMNKELFNEIKQILKESIKIQEYPTKSNHPLHRLGLSLYSDFAYFVLLLADFGFPNDALELIEIAKDEYKSCEITSFPNELHLNDDLRQISRNLNNYAESFNYLEFKERIAPIFAFSRILSQKTSIDERDSLTGFTAKALEFVKLAKLQKPRLPNELIPIAKVQSQMGDPTAAQRTLSEAKAIKIYTNPNTNVASAQAEIYDYEGALETAKLVKAGYNHETYKKDANIIDDYVEALTTIGHQIFKQMIN